MIISRTSYQEQYIRFFKDEDNTFWFSAVDIENILGYSYGSTSCFRRLNEKFISHRKIDDTCRRHSVRFVSEQGVRIALQAPRKNPTLRKETMAFCSKFFYEIIPSLRRSFEHHEHQPQINIFENENIMRHIEVSVPLNIFEKLSAFAHFTGQDIPHVLSGLAQSFVLKHQERIQQALENKKLLEAIKDDYMKVGDNT